jgi:Ca-activated chloride channel family protein
MVEWNTTRAVTLEARVVGGPDDASLLERVDALRPGGGTDLHAGLVAGYDVARRHFDPARLNRVVLISDGQANAGVVDVDRIASEAEDRERAGIYLVGVGVGRGFNDVLMDEVTDARRGAYVFVDTPEEATKLFVDRFEEVMEIALMDVQVHLRLPWYFQMRRFDGEEYSTSPKEVTPQHLAPDDAMVFHQILAACASDAVQLSDAVSVEASYLRPSSRVSAQDRIDTTVGGLLDAARDELTRGDIIVAYAEALKRASPLPDAQAHELLLGVQEEVGALSAGSRDPALTEIRELLQRYIELVAPR